MLLYITIKLIYFYSVLMTSIFLKFIQAQLCSVALESKKIHILRWIQLAFSLPLDCLS